VAYPPAARSSTARQPSVKVILTSADVQRVVDRIAHQILEKTQGAQQTVLLGIPTRGVPLARRLAARISAFEGVDVPVGVLDITLYRDDLRRHATRAVGPTDLPTGGIDGMRVVLVDDVLFGAGGARRAERRRPPGVGPTRRPGRSRPP